MSNVPAPLQLPKICLGTMTWGEQNTQDQGFSQMDYALEQGIHFWDTAEMYAVPPSAKTYATTEKIIGNWNGSRKRRDRIVLATKVVGRNPGLHWIRNGANQENGHGSESSLQQACEDSLTRLQTDYIDLYQLHWPERVMNSFGKLGFVPDAQDNWTVDRMAQTIKTLGKLQQQGKIRHWGVSNESAWGLMKVLHLADELGVSKPLTIQNPYSLLNRSAEVGIAEVCFRESIQFMAYSTLGMGMLTGKYDSGAKPAGARLSIYDNHFKRYSGERSILAAKAYNDLARKHGLNPAHMALAWVHSRAWMGSTIVAGTTVEQLQENLNAFKIVLAPEIIEAIEQIHKEFTYPAP